MRAMVLQPSARFDVDIRLDRGLFAQTVHGELSGATLRRLVHATLGHRLFRDGLDGLVDLAEADAVGLSAEDLRAHAAGLAIHRPAFRGSRIAWYAPRDLEFGMARMLEVLADGFGRERAVFRDRDEALAWLADHRDSASGPSSAASSAAASSSLMSSRRASSSSSDAAPASDASSTSDSR